MRRLHPCNLIVNMFERKEFLLSLTLELYLNHSLRLYFLFITLFTVSLFSPEHGLDTCHILSSRSEPIIFPLYILKQASRCRASPEPYA